MISLCFATQKGGAGKTTLAASLAVAAAQAGEKVVALDLDPQGSLAAWGNRREGKGPSFENLTVDGLPADRIGQLAEILNALHRKGFTDLSEAERRGKFSGHSLRAGLATAAQADERHVQKQLGHASAEMTRRYQRRRERFRINLTKAAGL